MFLFECLIFVCILYFAFLYFNTSLERLKLSAIPQPPLDSFFSGHNPTLDKAKAENRFLDLFVSWVAEYGTTILFWVGYRPFMFTADPAMMKQLSTDLGSFTKAINLPNRQLFGQKLVGNNSILSGNGLGWAVKRKMMVRFFAKLNMKELFAVCKPHMESSQLHRLKYLVGTGRLIDLHEELAITFTSYLQVLGLEKFLSPEEIGDKVYDLLEIIPKQLFNRWQYIFSTKKEVSIKMIQGMRTAAKQVVTERYEIMRGNPEEVIPNTDMLGFLIDANKTDGVDIQEEDDVIDLVIDDIMTVCLVMDNMVKQICSLFMFLEDCPEVQEKMFAELRATPVRDLEDLNKLKYTEKCLLEALRRGPALLRGTRTYTTDTTKRFGAYVVNSGSVRVHFSEYVMQHNETYWSNPKKFDPERWYPGFSPEPFYYLPFFVGSRGCIGKHMAMMLMKLTLSVFVKNFDLKQQFDTQKPPTIDQSLAVMRIINKVSCFVEPCIEIDE